jgi:hypothetical protein
LVKNTLKEGKEKKRKRERKLNSTMYHVYTISMCFYFLIEKYLGTIAK